MVRFVQSHHRMLHTALQGMAPLLYDMSLSVIAS